MGRMCKLIALAALCFGSLVAHGQNYEPVFGIQYDPKIVHFQKAPSLIGMICKDMREKALWVYAQWRGHDTSYFIVEEFGGEFGVAIAIKGNRCGGIDLDRFLYEGASAFSEQGIIVTNADNRRVMDNIAANIINGYSNAFGGKKNFLTALGKNANSLPDSPLRTKLEEFRKSQ